MFERFTRSAREIVRGAVERAERADADAVGEEELLFALLDRADGRGAAALAALRVGERRASVERALADARRRGGLSAADAEALAGLGIDLGKVVARVEQVHGAGALARAAAPRRSWRRIHRPFAPEARSALARALRIALARGDGSIGDEHLLLSLAAGTGPVAAVLAEHGAAPAAIERVLGARAAGSGPGLHR